jgi:hypothetical protein
VRARGAAAERAAEQGYRILQAGFVALPIVAGADKFLHLLVNWDKYLAPAVARRLPVSGHTFMLAVGVVEILAGLLVVVAPRYGGYVVAAWLWCIVANLLLLTGYYDVALRDVGLSLCALALARLSAARSPALPRGSR